MEAFMDRRALLTGAAAAVVAGLARANAQTTSAQAVKETVANAERSFADSMAKRDIAAFNAHLSPEAIFFGGPDGNTPSRGRTAIVEGWKRFFEGPAAPFSWAPDTTEVLDSGTLALTSGPVKNPKGDVTGRFSSIWRLESDGKWRVVFDKGCQVCR
jgi:ketosteroid isomerase-like protein